MKAVATELEWFEKHAMGRAYTWEKAPGSPSEEKSDRPGAPTNSAELK